MNLPENLFNLEVLFILKIFILLFEFFYIGFALIVIRQEKLMSQTVEIAVSSFFRLLVNANFFAGIALFILSLFLL